MDRAETDLSRDVRRRKGKAGKEGACGPFANESVVTAGDKDSWIRRNDAAADAAATDANAAAACNCYISHWPSIQRLYELRMT